MKSYKLFKIIPFALIALTLVFGFAFAFTSVQAADPVRFDNQGRNVLLQTPEAPEPPDIQVIPETGNDPNIIIEGDNNEPAGISWIVWVALGVAVLALLVAVMARGGGSTHYHD